MEIKSVHLDDFKLCYEVYGEGELSVVCFHGNNRSASDFQFLEQQGRKIISIHLFFHKCSTFSLERVEDGSMSVAHVAQLLTQILDREKVAQFHWVAYSQGGRFTFALLPLFAHRVKSLFMFAPDALDDSNFYSRSQRYSFTRSLFRRWLKKPGELMKIIRFLVLLRVLPKKIEEFMEYYTSDSDLFKMAYQTWSGFRNIRPSTAKIKEALEKNKIHYELIIGENDQIITTKSASKFLLKIAKPESLKTIPFGHNVFKTHIIPELLSIMNFEKYN